MPVVDRREFGGRFTVRENSQRLANYRYLEIQLIEMIAGWCHTTPQIAFKATFGYHVYDHARRSARGRLSGALRDSQGLARMSSRLWQSQTDDTVARLTAVYRPSATGEQLRTRDDRSACR
jgi:hypothetical protein